MRFNPKFSLTAVSAIAASLACATAAHADTPVIAGVSVYGTIDVGLGYQSSGVATSSTYGPEYSAFTTTRNFNGSQTMVTENGMEYSKVGIKADEAINADMHLIAQAEIGIVPLSGQIMDTCKSLAQNSGVGSPAAPATQNGNLDSALCGQLFNRGLFGGISSKTYGTLTFGRQNAPVLALLAGYDPQSYAPAFSFLGFSGTLGGAGSTGASRWDNTIKYAYATPQFHLVAQYAGPSADSGMPGKAYGGNIGGNLGGLSLDVFYEKEDAALNVRSSYDNGPNPLSGNGLAAFMSKNTTYGVVGKYGFDFADKSKLTLYAGYSHFEKAHANVANDSTVAYAQGGYLADLGIDITQTAKYDFEWVGLRYVLPKGMSVAAAYYNAHQNSWAIGLDPNTLTTAAGCSGAGLLCAGSFHEASLVVDKPVHKHVDVYAGINYSQVTNGLAWGYAGNQGGAGSGTQGSQGQTGLYTGVRVKF